MKAFEEYTIEEDFVIEEDEIKIDDDSIIEEYFSDDAFKDFLNKIRKYPLLSGEENKRLALLAQQGDEHAREKLINSNLRLVVSVAKRYKNRITHLSLLDIFQEGTLGLMKSIDKFDPEKGAFSTCAVSWIMQAVTRAIKDKEDEIRKPVHYQEKRDKYFKIVSLCKKENRPLPDDKTLCDILEISIDLLNEIRTNNKEVISLNQKVNEDDSETELENFIIKETRDFTDVENNIDNCKLFIVLKDILTPFEYYVIYFRYFVSPPETLDSLASKIYLTRERIRQKEEKALEKIQPYMSENSSEFSKKLNELMNKEMRIDLYNISPVLPDKVLLYLYLEESINDISKYILYYSVFGKMKIEYYINKLGISREEYVLINEELKERINDVYKNKEKFNNFKILTSKTLGSKLFNTTLKSELIDVDYVYIKAKYDKLSEDELRTLILDNNIELNNAEVNLLNRYFRKPKYKQLRRRSVEEDIYMLGFGYKDRGKDIPKDKLLKTYYKYIDEFDEKQQLYLESYFFNLIDKKTFYDKYPNGLNYDARFVITRLEKIYFHINNFFENSFNVDRWLYVKKQFPNKLTAERIELLDLFYGVNGKKYSITEIAKMKGENLIIMHDKISDARAYCISLYNNRTSTLLFDKELYKDYILDKKYEYTDETRQLLKWFILENKSYQEIAELTNLTRYRVSNIITEGIRRIDFYRFNMIRAEHIPESILKSFFEKYHTSFSEIEQQIIYSRVNLNISYEEILKKYNIPSVKCSRILQRFHELYLKSQVRNIELTTKEIRKEINCVKSETVVDDLSKEILSLYFGCKSYYNSSGIILSIKEIAEKYNMTENAVWKKYYNAIDKIKAKKINAYRNDLSFIDSEELDVLLEDIHLPISEKERYIICSLFGLKGYEVKNLDELASHFGDSKGSIRRRYQRAILNIYKYQNKEIDGIISYEVDIEPNLKYFSKFDSTILEEVYKNKLTYEDISKKYKLTFNQVVLLVLRIKDNLSELINNVDAKRFDFDYYREHKYDERLPFYADRKLAIECFEYYMGEKGIKRMSIPEIKKELNIDFGESVINNFISEFMLSFCKLKDGIVKVKYFSDDIIINYYLNNNEKMDKERLIIYKNYIKNSKREKFATYSPRISYKIYYDILKEMYPDYFDLTTATREQVLYLLKKYNAKINRTVKEYLMYKFDISEREFMNGKDLNHVYRILSSIDQQLLLGKPSKRNLKKKDS